MHKKESGGNTKAMVGRPKRVNGDRDVVRQVTWFRPGTSGKRRHGKRSV